METKISIFIISYNEENIISKCLEKLNWADEIVVVDSGSTDKTVAICESFGAKVIYNKFENFGKQKQFALNQTKNDWVLSLDADEVLSDDLINEIQNLKLSSTCYGYYIPRTHVFLNKIFKYGSESNKHILRFFNKKYGKFTDNMVHENLLIEGNTSKLKHDFLHYSYFSIEQYITKLNKYTTLYAQEKNKKFSGLTILVKTKFEFFKKYFLDRNFLNGKEGFYWAVFSAYYMFTKLVKSNENYTNSL